MTSIKLKWRTWGTAVSASALALLAVGCTGQTTLSVVEQPEGYEVDMKMDPLTLNPPQLGSLTFDITDKATGKRVTAFEPIFGSNTLLHNILVREDLEYMRHDTASFVVKGEVSVPAYFPTGGSYKAFAMYKPLGAEIQQYAGRIVSGEANDEPSLAETGVTAQVAGALRFDWVRGSEPLRAGRPQQLVFHVTERGQPVVGLWPVYGAPAQLWIVDGTAEHLWHAVGKAESRALLPEMAEGTLGATGTAHASTPGLGTPSPASNQGTSSGVGSSSDPVMRELSAGVITDTTPPTLVPDLAAALAIVTAAPRSTLQPVQQTAQSSVLDGPAVPPATGYGPTLVFEHTFREPGLYKLWVEVQYRDRVLQTDWVVRVVE